MAYPLKSFADIENLVKLFHRIIDDRIEKSIKGRQIRHNLHQRGGCARAVPVRPPPLDSTPTPSSSCTSPAAPTDYTFTPRPARCGEWGWLEGVPGQYRPPNLILTQSMHHKYTCSKRTNAYCAEFVFPLYSFLFCHLQFCELEGKKCFLHTIAKKLIQQIKDKG